MPTLFSVLREATGLTHQEAAAYFGVSPATLNSWNSGRRNPSEKNLELARALLARQAQETATRLASGDFSLVGDAEALAAGWPSALAWNLAIVRAWALADRPA